MPRYLVTLYDADDKAIDQLIGIYRDHNHLDEQVVEDLDGEADSRDWNTYKHTRIDDLDDPYPEWGIYSLDYVGPRGKTIDPYPEKIVRQMWVCTLPDSLSQGHPQGRQPSSVTPTPTPAPVVSAPAPTPASSPKGSTMSLDFSKLRNSMFREIDTVVLDGISGRVSIKNSEGLVSIDFDETGNHSLNVNPMTDMGMSLPAFAMAIPLEKAERGDIYVAPNGEAAFVTQVDGDKLRIVKPNGSNSKITPATNLMFGSKTVLVVKNMFGALMGTNQGGFNPMFLALMNKDGGSNNDMLMMMAMSQMGGTPGGMNPMMMMALMKK